MSSNISAQKRFYTLYEGDWTDPNCWTLNSSGSIADNPNNEYPGKSSNQDEVIILTGRSINLNQTITVKSVDIRGTLSIDKGLSDDVVRANPHALIIKDGVLKGTDAGTLEIRSLSYIWFENADGTQYFENNAPKTDAASASYIRAHNEFYSVGNIYLTGSNYQDISCISEFGSISVDGERFFALPNFTIHRDLNILSGAFFTLGSLNQSANVVVEGNVRVENGAVLMATPQFREYATKSNTSTNIDYWKETIGTFTVKGNFINQGNVVFAQVAPKTDIGFDADHNINLSDFYVYGNSYGQELSKQNCKMKLIFAGEKNSRFYITGHTDIYQLVCNKSDGYYVNVEVSGSRSSEDDDYSLITGFKAKGSVANYSSVEIGARTYQKASNGASLLRLWANVTTVASDAAAEDLPLYLQSGTIQLASGVMLNKIGPKLTIPARAELSLQGGELEMQAPNSTSPIPYIDLKGTLSISSGTVSLPKGSKGIIASNDNLSARFVLSGGTVSTTRLTTLPNCKLVFKHSGGNLNFDKDSGDDTGTYHRTTFAIAEGGEVHVSGGKINFSNSPDKDAVNTFYIDLKNDDATADFSKSTISFKSIGIHISNLKNTVLGNVELLGNNSETFVVPEKDRLVVAGNLVVNGNVEMRSPREMELRGNLMMNNNSRIIAHDGGLVDLYCTGSKNTKFSLLNSEANRLVLNSLTIEKSVQGLKLTIPDDNILSIGNPVASSAPGAGLNAIQGSLVGPVFFTASSDGQEIKQTNNADLTGAYLNFAGGALGNADKGKVILASNIHAKAAQMCNDTNKKCIVYLSKYQLKLNYLGYSNSQTIIPERKSVSNYTDYNYNHSYWTDGTASAGGLSLKLDKHPQDYENVLYPVGYEKGYAPAKINQIYTWNNSGSRIIEPLVLADCYYSVIPVSTPHPAQSMTISSEKIYIRVCTNKKHSKHEETITILEDGQIVDKTFNICGQSWPSCSEQSFDKAKIDGSGNPIYTYQSNFYWKSKVEDYEIVNNDGASEPYPYSKNCANGYKASLSFRSPTKDESSCSITITDFETSLEDVSTSEICDIDVNKINKCDASIDKVDLRNAYIYKNNKWHNQTKRSWWHDISVKDVNSNPDEKSQGYMQKNVSIPEIKFSLHTMESRHHDEYSWLGSWLVNSGSTDFDVPIDHYCTSDFKDAFAVVLTDADWTHGNKMEDWVSRELYSAKTGNWTDAGMWVDKDNNVVAAPTIKDVVHIKAEHTITSAAKIECNQLDVQGSLIVGKNATASDVRQLRGSGTIEFTIDVSKQADKDKLSAWKTSQKDANETANFLVPYNPGMGYDYSLFMQNPQATVIFRMDSGNNAPSTNTGFDLPSWIEEYPNLKVLFVGSSEPSRHPVTISDINLPSVTVHGDAAFDKVVLSYSAPNAGVFNAFVIEGSVSYTNGAKVTLAPLKTTFKLQVDGNFLLTGGSSFEKTGGILALGGNIHNGDFTSSPSVPGDVDKFKLSGDVYLQGLDDQTFRGGLTIADATEFKVDLANTVFLKSKVTQTGAPCSTLRLNMQQGKFSICPESRQNFYIAGASGNYLSIPSGTELLIDNADVYANVSVDNTTVQSILLDGKLSIGEKAKATLSTKSTCGSYTKVGGIGYLSNAELNMADNKATLTAAFIAPASDEGKITFYLGAVNTVNLGNGNENITRYADKGILDIRGASTVFTAGINSVINISATSANPETIPAIRNTAIRTTFINTDNNGVTFNINVPGKTVGVYSMPLQKVNIKENTTVKAMNMASWALQINGDLTTESGSTLDMNNYNLTLKGKWNHSGTYVPGTNTTTFSGVDFTSSVNTKFNNLTCDGQVSLTSDKILWVNGKFLLNTGDVTMKLKSGSSINGFVDVVDANVRPKGAQGKTDLPETSSNLLVCTGDVEIKYGTSIKDADVPYTNSPAGIFAYSQDEYTSLFCEGSMPVLRLSSDHFIQASKPQAYAMCITKQLQLAGAVLNIGSNRLRIMNGADIVNAEGDKTSSDFSMENMIASNLSNTDHGVEVEFVSGSSSVSLTLPIGSTGKYTPAILNELNMTVDMTKEAKERSLRIAPNALVFPGVNESEKNNVLQYYWTLYQGSGLTFVPGSGYMELETYFSDAKARDYVLTTENVAEKYGIAVLMKNSIKWIRKSNADIPGVVSLKGVTPEVIVLHYPQITGMTNLSGSYLAASNDAQLYVNEYISSGSGFAWTDGHDDSSVATWTRKYLDAEGKTVTVDPQMYSKSDLQGGRVTITGDSRIIVDGNGWQTTSMTIEGVGTINRENNGFLDLGETINHNFNVLAGRGWLGISRPELPAADYSSFIEPGGGTLVYMGGDKDNHKDYKILTSDASVNNVIITGSGKRTWNELSTLAVHGDFSLGTDIAVLTSEDLTLHIPDASTVRFGGNVYIGDGVMTGRGGYVFNGSAAQTLSHIQSSSNPFQAFTLTLQNANGLTTTMPINIGSEKDNIGSTLKFVAGKLTVGAGGSLTVYDNQSSSITGYSNTKYVVGQLSRNVGTGSFQVFPIGNETRYAPISLQGATTGMWTAEYSTSAIAKEESDVNNVSVLPSNSFWKINNENSKLARVKLHYSNEVIEGATPNKSTYTIVTTDISSAPGKWSEMPSNADVSWNLESVDAFSGKQQNGTEPRYVTFGRVKSDKKAPGWRGTESTDWFDKNNWSFKEVPGDNDDVVIPSNMTNYPLVGSATSANVGSITLEPGAKLTVSEATLQVNGNITVGSDYGLRVVHSPSKMSSVIADNIYKADGVTEYNTAWVYRYLVSGRLYYLGSAVYEGNGSNPASFAGGFAHLYNPSMEGAGQYNLYEDYSTKVASIGKNAIDEFTGSVKFSKWDKWEQVGKLYMNNQYQATNYTKGRGWNGWYLMTNPYPAPIRISDIDFGEGIEKSVHVRTFSVPSGQGEYIWATSSEDVSINGGNGVIAPHQAFFVKVKEGGDITSLKIRKPSNATTSSLKSASIEEQTKATIMANFKLVSENTQEENEYEMVWKFGNGSLDLTVDDTHLYLDGKQQLGVYKQGEILSIPSYPDINQMREYTFPLYVKVNDETNRASIKMPYSVFHYEYVEIVLVDKELGVEQDLRTNFKYTFDCEPGKEYKDRFVIRIYNSIGNPEAEEPENPEQEGVQTGIEDIENDECGSIAIFQNEDQVLTTISDDIFTGEATIRVIDVKGVIVAQKKIVENRGTIQLPSAKGIYIVEVVSGNAVEHRKVRK